MNEDNTDKQPNHSATIGRTASTCSAFIVQEKYKVDDRVASGWFDDIDQPEESTKSLELALAWLKKDDELYPSHQKAYDHRVIEQSWRVVHELPNV